MKENSKRVSGHFDGLYSLFEMPGDLVFKVNDINF